MANTSIWGNGQLLAFSGIDGTTSYKSGLCLRTIGGRTAFEVKLPDKAVLELDPAVPSACDLASDWFVLECASGTVRGVLADAWHLLIEGHVEVTGASEKLQILKNGNRTLLAVADFCKPELLECDIDAVLSARRWWADAAVERLGVADRPAAVKAIRQLKGQVYSAEGNFKQRWTTPDRWPHRGCWLWDSAFHAIGARHIDPSLARDAILSMFDGQQPDGMIPIRVNPDSGASAIYTQPPTLVLASWAAMQSMPDPVWLRPLLPRMKAYLEWDRQNRDGGNGLPCWAIESNPGCRSGESGLDNSTRFDEATRMEAVDFSSFMALEWELLGRLYRHMGDPAAAAVCAENHQQLCDLIRRRLWSAEKNFFLDYDLENNRFCPVSAVTGFLPLICGAATEEQAQMLAEHACDPESFGTTVPLPSVARNDSTYRPDMWCGPVWVNMAWLAVMGFERYGMHELANEIRGRMVAEIEHWHGKLGTMFEFFDADGEIPPDELYRKGRLAPDISPYHQCFHDYGWTATLYLDFVLSGELLL